MESEDSSKALEPKSIDLPLLVAPRNTVVYVDDPQSLAAAVESLRQASGPFAIDAERASGFKYSQRAYLIQIYRPGSSIYLIDPVAISPDDSKEPFEELAAVLATDTWLLHAASQDIPCLDLLGLRPSALFDTELASRLANLERVGLGSVCESQLEIRLAKEHSAVDWSTRPLQSDWLNYAALDVDVLHELHAALSVLLESQGKTEIAKQEFESLVHFKPKPAKTDRWRTVSGANELKDQQSLAMLRSLWAAREALAKKMDVSPGRIVPDRSLIAAIQANPKTKPELISLRSFSGRGSRTYIDTWFAALREGIEDRNPPPKKLPIEGIPNHRYWPNRFPEAAARLQQAKIAIIELGEALNIPQENVLAPDFVRQICWDLELLDANSIAIKLASFGARPWQVEAASQKLAAAFANPLVLDSDQK